MRGLEKTHHAWRVFSKPCTATVLLHCNYRFGHLKTEHTESLFLLRCHLGNWPRGPAVSMRSELLVAHENLGQLPLLTVYGMNNFNSLNAELNPIRHLLALVGARHIVHVSRIRVKVSKAWC